MFGIGGGEFMVIALIALIVVGPEQLPSVMRKVGETIAQLRSMSNSLRSEFMSGLQEADITRWGDGSAERPIVPRGFSPDPAQPDPAQADTARSQPARADAGAAPDDGASADADEPGDPVA